MSGFNPEVTKLRKNDTFFNKGKTMKRRAFIGGVATGMAGMLLPKLSLHAKAGNVYEIIAEHGTHYFGGTDQKPSDMMLYNAQSPGPMLIAKKSEMLEIRFKNKLSEPTTIHWHGIRNINEMDGVPELTQAAVEPGEEFIYRFPVNDAGTFWYHAHNKAWYQVAKGLYGPLIVLDKGERLDTSNIVLVADDWRLDNSYQIDEDSFGSLHDWSHGGRLGNWLTINGKSQPEITIARTGTIRLRLINAANARVMQFALDGRGEMEVVAIDGAPCTPFRLKDITLGPAQRLDIIISADDATRLMEISGRQPIIAADFLPEKDNKVKQAFLPDKQAWYPRPDITHARQIDIDMQGGAMGNLTQAEFNGEKLSLRELAQKHNKLWALNGVVGSYAHMLADVKLNEIIVLNVYNDSQWPHAMHLHGQHFWVRTKEFNNAPFWILRDTYLMQPSEKAQLIFVADNPGMWLFHCHMLEHHAAGMGGVIAVS